MCGKDIGATYKTFPDTIVVGKNKQSFEQTWFSLTFANFPPFCDVLATFIKNERDLAKEGRAQQI